MPSHFENSSRKNGDDLTEVRFERAVNLVAHPDYDGWRSACIDAAEEIRMKALVLSGGGARGAYEAGVITGLSKAGEAFDIICGTSIGSINGSLVAQNNVAELNALWHGIGQRGIITLDPQVQKLKSLVGEVVGATHDPILKRAGDIMHLLQDIVSLGSPSRLLQLLGVLQAAPIEKILVEILDVNNLKRNLIVSATNISETTSDTFYWFTDDAQQKAFAQAQGANAYPLTSGNFAQVIRASAAIPGAFPPVDIAVGNPEKTSSYVDGGVANNTPIGQAINAGATEITVIFMDPDETQPLDQPIGNLAQIAFACFSVMQQKILATDMKTAVSVNEAVKADKMPGKRAVTIRSVRPDKPLAVTVLQFDNQPLLDQAFDDGLNDVPNLKIESLGS